VQTVGQTKQGRQVDVELTLWPIPGPDGRPGAASVIAWDIRALKRAHIHLAKLYERERQIATTLQQSLMGTPAQIPGLETAHQYQPARWWCGRRLAGHRPPPRRTRRWAGR
jgi:hypothetical protein